MNARQIKIVIAMFLRILAYFSLILQWSWIGLVALPPLISSGALDVLTSPPAIDTQVAQSAPVESSPLLWVIIGVITLIILVVTAIILIRLPRAVLTTGEHIVHQAAEAVIPVVTHHKPLPSKKRRALSRRLSLSIQLIASLLPVIICLFLPAYEALSVAIIITIELWLVTVSIVCFIFAWLLEPQVITSRTRLRASRG